MNRYQTTEKTTYCETECRYSKAGTSSFKPDSHFCDLLVGHQGPHHFCCQNDHLKSGENRDMYLVTLMTKFFEMQSQPFCLDTQASSPEARLWWDFFMESLRLLSREVGAVTAGAPAYRKEAALAWLRSVWFNMPTTLSGEDSTKRPLPLPFEQFVDSRGSTARTGEMLTACAEYFR